MLTWVGINHLSNGEKRMILYVYKNLPYTDPVQYFDIDYNNSAFNIIKPFNMNVKTSEFYEKIKLKMQGVIHPLH